MTIGYLFREGVSNDKVYRGREPGQRAAPDIRFSAEKGTYTGNDGGVRVSAGGANICGETECKALI